MNVSYIALILIIIISVCMVFVNSAHAIGIEVRDKEGRLVIGNQESIKKSNPFELGVWAPPILITNLFLLFLVILNYKKKLPLIIKNPIKFILGFEVSHKIALIVIVSLIAIYVIFNVGKIWNAEEESWGDYHSVYEAAKNFSYANPLWYLGFRYSLLSISLNIFGNIRIMPFIESICLVVLTYFITTQITKKRFAGLISVTILIQSSLFLKYSVTATYDNSWILFYLLSLYLIHKKRFLSPLSYVLSLLSKPLLAIFLPITFFFIHMSPLSKKEKIRITLLYIIITIIPVTYFIYSNRGSSFDPNVFWTGFTAVNNFLRFDGLIVIFLIPLIVGLFVASKRGILHSNSFMILITGILWSAPLLAGFANITNQPYRFVPLVVFFAIGVPILFSNNVDKSLIEKKYLSTLVFFFSIVTVLISETLIIFPGLIQRTYSVAFPG